LLWISGLGIRFSDCLALSMPAFRLSILDQSPVAEGTAPADALHNSIDLAKLGERLGYHRY
jgi:hypothetical protein